MCLAINSFNETIKHTTKQAYVTGAMKSKVLSLLDSNTAVVARSKLVNEMKMNGSRNSTIGLCPLQKQEETRFQKTRKL